jgi:hypothetical protein
MLCNSMQAALASTTSIFTISHSMQLHVFQEVQQWLHFADVLQVATPCSQHISIILSPDTPAPAHTHIYIVIADAVHAGQRASGGRGSDGRRTRSASRGAGDSSAQGATACRRQWLAGDIDTAAVAAAAMSACRQQRQRQQQGRQSLQIAPWASTQNNGSGNTSSNSSSGNNFLYTPGTLATHREQQQLHINSSRSSMPQTGLA